MRENLTVAQANEEIFDKISKKPKQLKWYRSPFWNLLEVLTLPFRIITYPIRVILGKGIIDEASWSKRDANPDLNINERESQDKYKSFSKNQYELKRVDYSVTRNKNCSLILAINSKNTQNNRKLVINFHGNDVDAQNSQILSAALKDKDLTNDFMAIDYPKNATSKKELVDAGVSAVLRAISAGYKPEDITITGHSFGGAWSALVLKETKKYLAKDEKFEGYVNHKSFTDIGAVFVAQQKDEHGSLDISTDKKKEYQSKNKTFLSRCINFFGSLFGLQFDAKSALNDKELPIKQMKLYAGNSDNNVPTEASMAVAMEVKKDVSVPTQIKYNDTDHFEYAKGLFKPSKDHKRWSQNKPAPEKKYVKRIFKCTNSIGVPS